MTRRQFITLSSSAAAWPLVARAQQAATPVLGFLSNASPDQDAGRARAFCQGLSETGFVEGQNVAIEYRWAEEHYDRLPAMAIDLVRRQVAVIVAGGNPSAPAAKATTSTIPIVFAIGTNPIEVGLVTSLSRSGGNLTGVANLNVELGPKRLELLREVVPAATTFALLINPTNPNTEATSRHPQAAARNLGLELVIRQASTESEFDAIFASLGQRQRALVIGNDAFFNSRSEQLAALAVRHAVPAIHAYREFAAAGGLMSYGGSLTDLYRRAGSYTGRILKGEKPGIVAALHSSPIVARPGSLPVNPCRDMGRACRWRSRA
jgi:putative tryptophan/tyrosine transport system substrate-binding protein